MFFGLFYYNLKRCLNSDPEFIPDFQDYPEEEYEEAKDPVLIKKLKLEDEDKKLQEPVRSFNEWKLIFEIQEQEYQSVKFRSQTLLNEIFILTFNWESGKLFTSLYNNDAAIDAICRAFPFRKSIFNTPLAVIPTGLRCSMTELPCVIVELMRLLGQPQCLKTLGAFRVESSDTKTAEMELQISSGLESFDSFTFLQISNIGKMTLLKRFFRNIPGQLINRCLTNFMYLISLAFDDSPCLNSIIRWLLSCLSLETYKALAFLCLLLNSYAKHEQYNLMSAESLAICWGPIVFDVDANVEMISRTTKLLSLFIKNWDKFFLYPLK